MKKVIVCLSMITLFIIGCSKTDEETELRNSTANTGGTTPTCDTVNMKYSTNIQPIIQANCYNCHANGRAESGVTLETYNQVRQRATSGILVNVITHASGYPPMPYNLPKMSDCDINKIKAWIARGTPNN